MLGQHLCEGLCFTKPMALDWSNTHKHFMQLCCLALTPSVINCHWDKFSGLWHEFFGLQNGLQWESGLASNGRVRGFSPPFNQEAYLVWDITRKLFMYFHSTSALATALLSLCSSVLQILPKERPESINFRILFLHNIPPDNTSYLVGAQ